MAVHEGTFHRAKQNVRWIDVFPFISIWNFIGYRCFYHLFIVSLFHYRSFEINKAHSPLLQIECYKALPSTLCWYSCSSIDERWLEIILQYFELGRCTRREWQFAKSRMKKSNSPEHFDCQGSGSVWASGYTLLRPWYPSACISNNLVPNRRGSDSLQIHINASFLASFSNLFYYRLSSSIVVHSCLYIWFALSLSDLRWLWSASRMWAIVSLYVGHSSLCSVVEYAQLKGVCMP